MIGRSAHPLRHALPLFLVAGLCLSSLDATAKYLVRDHSLWVVVWARYAGQMVVVTPFAWHRAGPGFWRTGKPGLQLLRSLFLVLATLGFWGGLRYLPLAEASSITFLAPTFVVLLSWPLLHERAPRARQIASTVGFIGILILLRPGSAVMHPAVVLLLAAALANALYQLLTRRLLDEKLPTTLFYSASVGTVVLTLGLPFATDFPRLMAIGIAPLVLLGVLAGIGHWCMTHAYLLAPASLLSPFTYLQILWATAFGYLMFGQHPDRLSALGMAVVVASGVALALWERRRTRLL
ncbi:MAG TPA: DMT family transporter [Casimicrobiaceae bacterium]|nr:DMT family transporter [Casimicrobiaceae bacterium]